MTCLSDLDLCRCFRTFGGCRHNATTQVRICGSYLVCSTYLICGYKVCILSLSLFLSDWNLMFWCMFVFRINARDSWCGGLNEVKLETLRKVASLNLTFYFLSCVLIYIYILAVKVLAAELRKVTSNKVTRR